MEEIFWHAAEPLTGDGDPSAMMLAGMPVGAADGMVVNVAESPKNRRTSARPGPRTGLPRSRSCGSSR